MSASASKFYITNPADPEAPVVLAEYASPHHGTIRPGDRVTYDNPAAQWLGNPTPDGGPMTVTELLRFPALPGRDRASEYVMAVLDGGTYDCSADNLRPIIWFPSLKAFYADRPEREASPESDYGVWWRADGKDWPVWRVSYVQATGEICAVQQHGACPVRVLGVVPPDPAGRVATKNEVGGIAWSDKHSRSTYYDTLDKILDGWADPDVSGFDLAWIERKLADHKGGQAGG